MTSSDHPSRGIPREAAAELRHELRTPVNHIIGYAEMLQEDASEGSSAYITLTGILATARDVLERINAALPPSGVASEHELTGLLEALRTPQRKLLEATALLEKDSRDAQFMADVSRIAEAARKLTNPPRPVRTQNGKESPLHAAAAGKAAQPAARARTPGHILVVDDVEDNRAVLTRRLEREGYRVDQAASGADALTLMAREPFDLVLLDVMMPVMDGFEVLERLKAAPESRDIPVIMISALDDLASVVRCIEHGAEDYLPKPFDPVLLRARIGASLDKKRLRDREADYLRLVSRVIDAAGAVEQGTYKAGTLAGLTDRGDELGRMARVFDSMAAGIRAREERLHTQLKELRADVSLATSEYDASGVVAAMESAEAFAAGTVLGDRYEILTVIGRGGMGVVYHARDRELNEDVAVKTIRHELLTGDPVMLERFKTEIRLARRISHRNVVRTHDLGESDGTAFVTMEFVRGITVRELLSTRGRLGVSSTLALARQFAEALAVAHAAGVIHRDVKPENALIDGDGVLKVMDFGIARLAEASPSRTQTGMIVGTPAYMAPEQIIGEEIDLRADLYSLGAVMYECLTGRAPFTAPSAVALVARVLTTEPTAPDSLNPDVPPALSALVLRLLAKSADSRPASASALIEQLAELG